MASSNNSLLSLSLYGFDDLEAALRALADSKAIRKALSTALLEAAQPAARDARARARAHRKSGRTDEGVEVSTTLSRRQRRGRGYTAGNNGTTATVYIGASPMGPAVLEEFGTTKRHWKTGKSTGAEPAFPFMRPAWEAHKGQILVDFGRYLWVTIEAEAKRLARKQASLIAKGGSS